MVLDLPFMTTLPTNILFDIVIMIIAATVLALIARALKQPLIPVYIITGLLIGPVFGLIKTSHEIQLLSELGIAFLLFIVGLEISFRKLKDVGIVSLVSTLPQIVLIFLVGFYVATKFFLSSTEAVFLGFILAFSSTMVVVKLLVDRHEINTLHGRIVLGIMLVQDLIVLFVIPTLSTTGEYSFMFFALILLKVIGLIVFATFLSKYILPFIFERIAKSHEVLFLTSLSILFVFMALSTALELSVIIGAFIAGVALANLPYNVDIIARVRSLRDFFTTLFFVSLGLQFVPINLDKSFFMLFAILFFAVVILKPLIVFFTVLFLGYKDRTAFISGMSIGQISEFSLIIASQAFISGKISQNLLSLTILLAIFTITITSYLIKFNDQIYSRFSFMSKFLGRISFHREQRLEHQKAIKKEVLLLGCHRTGSILYDKLKKLKRSVFVIDFDPDIIKELIDRGIPCMYGDIINNSLIEEGSLRETKWIISTIPDDQVTRYLIHQVKRRRKKINLVVTARQKKEAERYYEMGADYVIFPDMITGQRVAHFLEEILKHRTTLKRVRDRDIKEITHCYRFK